MTPYDMKRELKQLYAPKNRDWQLLMIPPQRFIAVGGHGDPNTAEAYAEAVTALYGVAYAIKFACKREATERDFVVAPLEGLWYTDDASAFTARAKALWSWTLLIAQPSWVTDAMIDTAIDSPRLQKAGLAGLEQVHVENIDEGLSAQLLHVGSYDDEAPALKRLHDEFLPHHDLAPGDPHHEIYLSDPRKTERAKLKTVLRQPVVRAWPDADPNTSAAESSASIADPNTSAAESSTSIVESSTSAADPSTSIAESSTSAAESSTSAAERSTSAAEPGACAGASG